MFEHDAPADAPTLEAWVDGSIGKVRVTATPGGIALDADEVRAFRDELDALADELEADDA